MPQFKLVSLTRPRAINLRPLKSWCRACSGPAGAGAAGRDRFGQDLYHGKVIERLQRPALVLAHNKTLAAQLCAEFKEFFPENAVEYFVSYYDYYQPEAYIPHTDTYIEKDASTNDEIDRLRLSATCALLERRDVIVVSSASCIYGLGEPEDFAQMMISILPAARWIGRSSCAAWWRSAMNAMTSPLSATCFVCGAIRWRFGPLIGKILRSGWSFWR